MNKIAFFLNEFAPKRTTETGMPRGYFDFETTVWRKLLDLYVRKNPEGAEELLVLTYSELNLDQDDPKDGCVPFSSKELEGKLALLKEMKEVIAEDPTVRFWEETPWYDEDGDEYDIESDLDQEDLLCLLDNIIDVFKLSIEVDFPLMIDVE